MVDYEKREMRVLTIEGGELMSGELVVRLDQALDDVEAICETNQAAALLISIVGTSDAAKITTWPGSPTPTTISRWERSLYRLERSDVLVISVAQSRCSGLALELLLVSDWCFATEDLRLDMKSVGGQLWPGISLHRLVRRIGEARARKVLLEVPTIHAESAQQILLVDEIVKDFASASQRTLDILERTVPAEIAVRRRLIQDCAAEFHDILGSHLAACDRALRNVPGAGGKTGNRA
jgi:isomerase DpgB